MNLFGKARASKTTPKDAIVKLRETLEMLEKREKYLQTKIDNELKFAKLNATKNKRGGSMKVDQKYWRSRYFSMVKRGDLHGGFSLGTDRPGPLAGSRSKTALE